MPIYSIITAVGPDADSWLPDCGQSLENQLMPDDWQLQWMLWTDGSTPSKHTLQTAHNAQQAGVLVSLGATGLHQGPAVARNLALYSCQGKLARQLDADDALVGDHAITQDIEHMQRYPHHVYRASRTINQYQDGMTHVWGAPDEDGIPIAGTEVPARGVLSTGWIADQLISNDGVVNIHCGAVCFRTLAARALGGWLGIWPNEDTGLIMRLSEAGPGWYDPDHISHLYRFWEGASTADFFADELSQDSRIIQSWEAVTSLIHCSRMHDGWQWKPTYVTWSPGEPLP